LVCGEVAVYEEATPRLDRRFLRLLKIRLTLGWMVFTFYHPHEEVICGVVEILKAFIIREIGVVRPKSSGIRQTPTENRRSESARMVGAIFVFGACQESNTLNGGTEKCSTSTPTTTALVSKTP
jgi:hypothetical protein